MYRTLADFDAGRLSDAIACESLTRLITGDSFDDERLMVMHTYTVSQGKGGSRLDTDYAFSPAAADSVRPLTMLTLKRAYPDTHRFHDQLDVAFRSDAELIQYEDFHHEYRVARLLRLSLP